MSTLKVNTIQIGQSSISSNNYVLAVPSIPNGTLKLSRGIVGSTVLDVMTIDTSGNMVANVTTYSDARMKTDISTILGALDRVQDLRGVLFTRLDGTRGTGLIAQDLVEVLPEAVITDENGMMSVAYGNVVGLLVEAIKELRAEVEELKRK